MAIVLDTYPTINSFPEITPDPFINVPVCIGLATTKIKIKQEPNLYEPFIPDWFQKLEEKILHDPIDRWEIANNEYVWKKDSRGIWVQNQNVQRSDVFWDRKKDGRHIEPEQIYYTNDDEKRIIPAREILDDNYGKNKKRNDTIEKIRDKFLRGYKTGRGNYENLGNYYYKSRYHKELFLEIVPALGLTRKAEPKKSTVEITSCEYNKEYMTNRYQEDEL